MYNEKYPKGCYQCVHLENTASDIFDEPNYVCKAGNNEAMKLYKQKNDHVTADKAADMTCCKESEHAKSLDNMLSIMSKIEIIVNKHKQ